MRKISLVAAEAGLHRFQEYLAARNESLEDMPPAMLREAVEAFLWADDTLVPNGACRQGLLRAVRLDRRRPIKENGPL